MYRLLDGEPTHCIRCKIKLEDNYTIQSILQFLCKKCLRIKQLQKRKVSRAGMPPDKILRK